MILLANGSTADRLRDQLLKSRGPRLGKWCLHEPIPHAHNVDGCCRQHLLETRVRLPNLPGVSSPIRPDPLAQRALKTRAAGLLGRLRCGGFACTGGWPCDVVILPTHSDRPSCRTGTVDPTRTGPSFMEHWIFTTSWVRSSTAGVQLTRVYPPGHVARCGSPSIWQWLALHPCAARAGH